jgi:hypothetical protein
MKKTYATPAVVMTGTVVNETTNAITGDAEPGGFKSPVGGVGFNL